jgi:hypothetical protein
VGNNDEKAPEAPADSPLKGQVIVQLLADGRVQVNGPNNFPLILMMLAEAVKIIASHAAGNPKKMGQDKPLIQVPGLRLPRNLRG